MYISLTIFKLYLRYMQGRKTLYFPLQFILKLIGLEKKLCLVSNDIYIKQVTMDIKTLKVFR